MSSVMTRLQDFLKDQEHTLHEIYEEMPEVKRHTIRARLNENVGKCFRRISRGMYIATNGETQALIVAGDNLEGARSLESNSIDFIITDSNYPSLDGHLKVGTTRKKDGKWGFKTEEISPELLKEMHRVLKPGGHFYTFLPGDSVSDYANTLDYNNRFMDMCSEAGFSFRKRLIWHKGRTMGYPYASAYEQILFYIKGKKCSSYNNKVTNVLDHPKLHNSHPLRKVNETVKPVELLKDLISVCSQPGDIGVDFHGGSLSFAQACLETKRHSITFEIDKEQINKALASRGMKARVLEDLTEPCAYKGDEKTMANTPECSFFLLKEPPEHLRLRCRKCNSADNRLDAYNREAETVEKICNACGTGEKISVYDLPAS